MNETLFPREDFASLCVISHGRFEKFRDSIASLLRTTEYPFELLVHEDGGADERTYNYIFDLVKAGAISMAAFNPMGHNMGQGASLNRLFNAAHGDPIYKLDADLTYNKHWLEDSIGILKANNDIGLLGLLHYQHDPVDSEKTVFERRPTCSLHSHILGSGFALRREVWEELGPFEEYSDAFAEDYMMQRAVTDSDKWACGLPKTNLVENHAMGIGHSVVVTEDGSVKKIKKSPLLINS